MCAQPEGGVPALFYTGRMTPLPRRSVGSCGPRRSAYAAMLAGVLLLVGVPAAVAHDELTESEPAPNASLEKPPEQLRLSFSGDLATLGAQLQVNGPLGSATEGDPVIEGSQVRQKLNAAGGSGDYEAVWRATSQDGHPISGSFGYTVLPAADEDSDPTQTESTPGPGTGESEDPESTHTDDPESTRTEDSDPTQTDDPESTHTEHSDPGSGDSNHSESTHTQDLEPTQTGDSEDASTQDSADASPQDADDTATQDSEAASTTQTEEADKAARTDAVVIASEPNSAGGVATWMWALIAVALVALAGVGTVAVRRR